MDDRRARIAKNEALLRQVNEQIDALNDAGPQVDVIPLSVSAAPVPARRRSESAVRTTRPFASIRTRF